MLAPWKKSYDKPRQHTQKAETFSSVQFSLSVVSDSLLPDKGLYSQRSGFSRSHVWMWELDHTEGWAQNNGYFWTVVLEKTLESPLDCKEINRVNPKGNQSWIFTGRTDTEAEVSIVWQPDVKNWLIRKDTDAGKDLRQDKKGMTVVEMDAWMTSLTHWTWVWAGSRSWWWTGKSGMLQSTGSQRVGNNWVTELDWGSFFAKPVTFITLFFHSGLSFHCSNLLILLII